MRNRNARLLLGLVGIALAMMVLSATARAGDRDDWGRRDGGTWRYDGDRHADRDTGRNWDRDGNRSWGRDEGRGWGRDGGHIRYSPPIIVRDRDYCRPVVVERRAYYAEPEVVYVAPPPTVAYYSPPCYRTYVCRPCRPCVSFDFGIFIGR